MCIGAPQQCKGECATLLRACIIGVVFGGTMNQDHAPIPLSILIEILDANVTLVLMMTSDKTAIG